MVITLSSKGRAFNVPVLLLAIGAGLLLAGVDAWRRADAWDDVYVGLAAAFAGAGSAWMGLSEGRGLVVSGEVLLSKGTWRRVALERQAALFGVRHQGGWRSSRFTVFVTDGTLRDDIAEFQSERGARSAIVRLERALLPLPPDDESLRRSRRRAAATVRSLEKDWKTNADAAQAQIDAYYASPSWRRAKYGVIAVVVLYSIAMLIYGALQP